MLGAIRRYLPTLGGRVATGLASMVAIVVFLWPGEPWTFDIQKAVAVAITGAAWLFAELSGSAGPSGHDLRLFDEFRNTFTQQERTFLRDQDFWHAFIHSRTEGLREMADWTGAAHEFVDPQIQKRWAPVLRHVVDFVTLMAQHTGPGGGKATLMTVHPPNSDPENPAPRVLEAIQQLNKGSTELYKELEDFERYARRRLAL